LKEPVRRRRKVKNAVYKHSGNLTFEQVKNIAKKMTHKTLAREFKGTVKEVLGSCLAVGITVDRKNSNEVTKEVENGQHNL
jgi:large subunit ribosomal protein L12e